MQTEWWVELRVKVPTGLQIDSPSLESGPGSGSESGRERTGECRAVVRWKRRGLPDLRQRREQVQAATCEAGSDQMSVGRGGCSCRWASVSLLLHRAGLGPPRGNVAHRASGSAENDEPPGQAGHRSPRRDPDQIHAGSEFASRSGTLPVFRASVNGGRYSILIGNILLSACVKQGDRAVRLLDLG